MFTFTNELTKRKFHFRTWETFLNITYRFIVLKFKKSRIWILIPCCFVLFRRGEVVVYSDNIVALSHVREFISGDATKRNIQLTIHADVSKVSTTTLVHRIHQKIVQLVSQRNQNALSAALKEAVTEQLSQDAEGWMSKQFHHLLASSKEEKISSQTIEQYRSTFLERSIQNFINDLNFILMQLKDF